MAVSVSASSSQSTNEGANQSTVYGNGSVTLTVGNFYGLQSHGTVTIGDQTVIIDGPTSMSAGSTWSWSWPGGRTYDHNAAGQRGDVGVSVSFYVDGTTLHRGSATAATQPGLDYTRLPTQPAAVTAAKVGSSIVVSCSDGSSYSGLPITGYYVSYRSSSNGGGTWGSWSSNSTMSGNQYTYTSLTPGLTYQFRVYVTNSEGSSGYAESATLFLTAGGKYYNGTNFALAQNLKVWNDSAWVSLAGSKYYNGSAFTSLL